MNAIDMVAALSYLEKRIQTDPNADANIKELTSAVRAMAEDHQALADEVQQIRNAFDARG